ncbi:hypothetical protein [Methylotetracoccus oryzae]|uniref:hypothetical protein n=1 Tax=Methylotetracoccus oryzae TaxID=1919059 RepID=UPI00111BC178|nr:hypothetical protein [Methylotetracoccus oryzae]
MIALSEKKLLIPLKSAKATGLNDLGVPQPETAVIRKGTLHELTQRLESGAVGRRFQNLRVIAIKATEGGIESAKVFIQFEVFGDDNVPETESSGFEAALYGGSECLFALRPGAMFMPYARSWYENRFVFDIPIDVFERADGLEFTARADSVRAL